MTARVRELATEVSVEDRSWRFELDSRRGTASIQLDAQRFTLRVQSWREKRLLARFAHLGEAFLEDQLLRGCLEEGSPPPADGPQREALIALALWLNAPGGKPGLPLDQQLLAGVTLQVCQAIHAGPQAFDGLDAADVELFWQAVRAGAAPLAESQPANRIVVIPDAPASSATRALPLSSPAAPAPSTDDEQRQAGRVPEAAAHEPEPADEPSSDAGAAVIDPANRGEAQRAATPVRADPLSPRETLRAPVSAGRFRVLLDSRAHRPPHRAAPPRPDAAAGARPSRDQGPLAAEMLERSGPSGSEPSPPQARTPSAGPMASAPLPGASAPAHPLPPAFALDRRSAGARASEPDLVPPAGGPHSWPAAANPQAAADCDAVFEELAARLEQAAAEQGIDLET